MKAPTLGGESKAGALSARASVLEEVSVVRTSPRVAKALHPSRRILAACTHEGLS
jgi:hypothetical protein